MATQVQERKSTRPSLWAWVGGIAAGTGIVAAGSYIVWRIWFKPKTAIKPEDAPKPPAGMELIVCEAYKSRTLCVLRDTNAPTPPFQYTFNVDGGSPPETTLYGTSAVALEQGKLWVDALPKVPKPEGMEPVVEPDGSPVAVGEPPEGDGMTVGVEAIGVNAHGLRALFNDAGQCATLEVLDENAWTTWAAGLVEGINLTIWDAEAIADRIYEETLPLCGDSLSEIPGVTVQGMPYADMLAQLQSFLDGLKAETIVLPPGQDAPTVIAGLLVGEPYVPPAEDPTTQVPQFDIGTGGSVHKLPGAGGLYTVVLTIEKVTNPALGQTLTFIRWRVWQPGAVLELGNEVRTGTVPAEQGTDAALAAAKNAIPIA